MTFLNRTMMPAKVKQNPPSFVEQMTIETIFGRSHYDMLIVGTCIYSLGNTRIHFFGGKYFFWIR